MKALSSRFSDANCSTSEGIRLSGERVITRVDSFHSTSPSSPLGRTPPPPDGRTGSPQLLCERPSPGADGKEYQPPTRWRSGSRLAESTLQLGLEPCHRGKCLSCSPGAPNLPASSYRSC